jgi:hypothetical protein
MTYDQSLEGPVISVYSGPQRKEREVFDSDTGEKLKENLIKIKNLQDISFNIGDNDGPHEERAFIKTLEVLDKWMKGPNANVTLEGEIKTVNVSGITELLSHTRILVWNIDDNGNKQYHTLSFLKNIGFGNVTEMVSGIQNMTEDYQGLNTETMGTGPSRIVRSIGLQFFRYDVHERGIRKATTSPLEGNKLNLRRYGYRAGSFFPYISTIPINLHVYQIYTKIQQLKDNCFVHACRMSGLLTDPELDELIRIVRTRAVPKKDVKIIASQMKVNFIVRSFDENKDVKHQMVCNCDTTKLLKKDFGRTIELFLYKDHYLLYKPLAITK